MHITKRCGGYRITVSCGRDESGKQILCTTTFAPPKGLTEKQEKRLSMSLLINMSARSRAVLLQIIAR